jgi:hypothetical protein
MASPHNFVDRYDGDSTVVHVCGERDLVHKKIRMRIFMKWFEPFNICKRVKISANILRKTEYYSNTGCMQA